MCRCGAPSRLSRREQARCQQTDRRAHAMLIAGWRKRLRWHVLPARRRRARSRALSTREKVYKLSYKCMRWQEAAQQRAKYPMRASCSANVLQCDRSYPRLECRSTTCLPGPRRQHVEDSVPRECQGGKVVCREVAQVVRQPCVPHRRLVMHLPEEEVPHSASTRTCRANGHA